MQAPRRHPLATERFLEGPRQGWCAVFTALGVVILLINAMGRLPDPAPFLTFFTGIGVTFILGASAGDVMKSYRVDSANVTSTDLETATDTEVRVDPKDVTGIPQ